MTVSTPDTIVVDFESDYSHNWPSRRKWLVICVLAIPLFLILLSSTITTPAVTAISAEFYIDTTITEFFILSLFLLIYCLGPVFSVL